MGARHVWFLALALWGCDDAAHDDSPAPVDAGLVDAQRPDVALDAELVIDALVSDAGPDVGPDVGLDAGCALDDTDLDDDGLTGAQECALGTDPARADSDDDGVLDGVEVGEGTNPADPSEALRLWPERLTTHPRLFFGPEDLPTLRARAANPDVAQASLLRRIEGLAASTPPEHPEDGSYLRTVPQRQGAIAEAQAFLALLREDAALAEEAAAIMAAPFPSAQDLTIDSNYDLSESESLVAFCGAYDTLAAHPTLDPALLAGAELGLRNRLAAFRDMVIYGPLRPMTAGSRNNHSMKVQGALGLCALALPDRETAAWDLSEAMTGLEHLLTEYQGAEQGGYGESWNYLSYGGNTFLPFMAAYHRLAPGETRRYTRLGQTAFFAPDRGSIREVVDLATHPRTREIYEAARFATQPDGRTPATDDANPSALHGGLLAWMLNDTGYLRDWLRPELGYPAGRTEVATFALYDGAAATGPDGPMSASLPEAGFAVIREGWGEDDAWLMVIGEHGLPRAAGLAHEHPDGASFLLYEYGVPLLIDPGYIEWSQRELVNTPADHNRVLVDGEGPAGNGGFDVGADAWLEGFEQGEGWATVAVRTAFAEVALWRRVLRSPAGVVVVADAMEADEAHTYTAMLHGLEAEGGFELDGARARWTQAGAWVEVQVQATAGEATMETALAEHQTGHGHFGWHTALATSAAQAQMAGFLTVATTGRTGDEAPEVRFTQIAEGVLMTEVGGERFWLNRTDAVVEVPDGAPVPMGLSAEWDGATRTWAMP